MTAATKRKITFWSRDDNKAGLGTVLRSDRISARLVRGQKDRQLTYYYLVR